MYTFKKTLMSEYLIVEVFKNSFEKKKKKLNSIDFLWLVQNIQFLWEYQRSRKNFQIRKKGNT